MQARFDLQIPVHAAALDVDKGNAFEFTLIGECCLVTYDTKYEHISLVQMCAYFNMPDLS